MFDLNPDLLNLPDLQNFFCQSPRIVEVTMEKKPKRYPFPDQIDNSIPNNNQLFLSQSNFSFENRAFCHNEFSDDYLLLEKQGQTNQIEVKHFNQTSILKSESLLAQVTSTIHLEVEMPSDQTTENNNEEIEVIVIDKTKPPQTSIPVVENVENQEILVETPSPTNDYKLPPQIAPEERINPLTTTIMLNGMPISHLSEWEIIPEMQFGDNLNDDLDLNGILKIDSQVIESLSSNNIFETRQTGDYLQLDTFGQRRVVATTRREPLTMLGLELQMTFVGACLFGYSEGQYCSYTPGLVIDRDSIDPNFGVPTRVFQTSQVGDPVSEESMAAMRQPGFQGGANGESFGVDLLFPNMGSFQGNSQTIETTIQRDEVVENSVALTTSHVEQVVKTNDRQAVLGRTIYGFPFIIDNDDIPLNHALPLLNAFLPTIEPSLEGSENSFNPNINKNLFLAANNSRLPNNSYTIYQGGIGSADSTPPNLTSFSQVPAGTFNSLWFGLSPVMERQLYQTVRYEPTGETVDLVNAGGEGGTQTSNVQFMSAVNDDIFSTDNIQDTYTQIYLRMFAKDVDLVTETLYKENLRFVPHVSFTGNITNSDSILRYYGGSIFDDQIRGYLGTDYSYLGSDGFRYNLGGVVYTNPDRDYYSHSFGNISKAFVLNPDLKINLSTGLFYAFDRATEINEIFVSSQTNTITFGTGINWQNIFLGASYNIDNVLPNALDETLALSVSIPINQYLQLSGTYAPIDENTTRNRGGISAIFQLDQQPNSPQFVINWSNYEYYFGKDDVNNDLNQTDNRFTFMIRFGHPASPFDPTTAEQLRNQPFPEEDN